jgi:phosphatidylglycerophosphate synthase
LRLLCNLLDGLVAVEGGLGSRSGEVWNDLPDRIADPLLLVSAGYATGVPFGPELGWSAGLLVVLTAYVRLLGAATGLPQRFTGPMAKPQRMAVLTVALLLGAVVVPWRLEGALLAAALALVVVGAALTVVRRTAALITELEER